MSEVSLYKRQSFWEARGLWVSGLQGHLCKPHTLARFEIITIKTFHRPSARVEGDVQRAAADDGLASPALPRQLEREFFIDNLLVQIHLIVEMILVDRPCAMGVLIPFSK